VSCSQLTVPAVILGFAPNIQPSASVGAGWRMDGRDKPDHDKLHVE
jgi:hypothetical protein